MASSKMSTRKIRVTPYMRNVGRSLGYAVGDAVAAYNPTISNILKTTRETIYDAKTSMGQLRAKSLSNSGDNFAANSFNNLIDDLKTGNWYNKKRMDDAGFDFDFDDDFDWGDDDDESSSGSLARSIVEENESTSREVINSVNQVGSNISRSFGYASAQSADYIVKSTNKSLSAMYQLNAQGFNQVSNILLGMNTTLVGIAQLGQPLSEHMQNSALFYTNATRALNNIDENIAKIAKRTEFLEQTYGGRNKKNKKGISNFVFGDEFDFSSYVEMVKENYKTTKDMMSSMIDMAKTMTGNGKNTSPTAILLTGGIKAMIPKIAKEAMEEFNKNLNDAITIAMTRGSKKAKNSNNIIANILGSIFLPEDNYYKKYDSSNYNKGAFSWDGIARKSLVEVIPTYLAKIYAALGGEEKYFDYAKGKFVTIKQIREDSEHKEGLYAKRAAGGFRTDLLDSIKNDSDKEDMEKELEMFFISAYVHNIDLDDLYGQLSNPKFIKDNGLSAKSAAYIRKYIKDARGTSGSKNKRNLLKFEASRARERDNYSNRMREEEASGLSPLAYAENGFNNIVDQFNTSNATQIKYLRGLYSIAANIYTHMNFQDAAEGAGATRFINYDIDHGDNFKNKTGKIARGNTKVNDKQDSSTSTSQKAIDTVGMTSEQIKAYEKKQKMQEMLTTSTDKASSIIDDIKNRRKINFSSFKSVYDTPFIALANMLNTITDGLMDVFYGKQSIGDLIKEKFKSSELYAAMGKTVGNIKNTVKNKVKTFWYGGPQGVATEATRRAYDTEKAYVHDPMFERDVDATGSGLPKYSGGDSGLTAGKAGASKVVYDGVGKLADGVMKFINQAVGSNKDTKAQRDKMFKVIGDVGEAKGAIGVGAIAGAGVSLLTGAILGPIAGAAIGAGVGLMSKSKAFQDVLFGEGDPDSDQYKAGILGSFGKLIKSNMPHAKDVAINTGIGGGIGIAAGILTGSPILGLFAGSAIGFATKSEKFKTFLFGDEYQDGLISKEFAEKIKDAAPNIAAGALAGIVAGPFGLVGNILAGSALGFLTTTDTFHEFMFGEDGLATNIHDKIMTNLDDLFKNLGAGIVGFSRNLISSVSNHTRNIFEAIRGRLTKAMDSGTFFGKVLKFGAGVINAPINLVGGVTSRLKNGLKRSNLKKGYDVYDNGELLDAMGRNALRNKMGLGQDNFDTILANVRSEQELDDIKDRLKSVQNRKYAKLKADNDAMSEFYNGIRSIGDDLDAKTQNGIADRLKKGKPDDAIKYLTSRYNGPNLDAYAKLIADIGRKIASNKDDKKLRNANIEVLKGMGLGTSNSEINSMLGRLKTQKKLKFTKEQIAETTQEDYQNNVIGLLTHVDQAVSVVAGIKEYDTGLLGKFKSKKAVKVATSVFNTNLDIKKKNNVSKYESKTHNDIMAIIEANRGLSKRDMGAVLKSAGFSNKKIKRALRSYDPNITSDETADEGSDDGEVAPQQSGALGVVKNFVTGVASKIGGLFRKNQQPTGGDSNIPGSKIFRSIGNIKTETTQFGIIKSRRNNQGEWEVDKQDSQTNETMKKSNSFFKSISSIPIISNAISGMNGLVSKIKTGLFGGDGENNKFSFKNLLSKISSGIGIISKVVGGIGVGILGVGALGGLLRSEAGQTVINGITGSSIFETVKNVASNVGETIGGSELWKNTKEYANTLWDSFKESKVGQIICPALENVGKVVKSVLDPSTPIGSIVRNIGTLTTTVIDSITSKDGVLYGIGDKIAQLASGLIDDFVNGEGPIYNLVSSIGKLANNILDDLLDENSLLSKAITGTVNIAAGVLGSDWGLPAITALLAANAVGGIGNLTRGVGKIASIAGGILSNPVTWAVALPAAYATAMSGGFDDVVESINPNMSDNRVTVTNPDGTTTTYGSDERFSTNLVQETGTGIVRYLAASGSSNAAIAASASKLSIGNIVANVTGKIANKAFIGTAASEAAEALTGADQLTYMRSITSAEAATQLSKFANIVRKIPIFGERLAPYLDMFVVKCTNAVKSAVGKANAGVLGKAGKLLKGAASVLNAVLIGYYIGDGWANAADVIGIVGEPTFSERVAGCLVEALVECLPFVSLFFTPAQYYDIILDTLEACGVDVAAERQKKNESEEIVRQWAIDNGYDPDTVTVKTYNRATGRTGAVGQLFNLMKSKEGWKQIGGGFVEMGKAIGNVTGIGDANGVVGNWIFEHITTPVMDFITKKIPDFFTKTIPSWFTSISNGLKSVGSKMGNLKSKVDDTATTGELSKLWSLDSNEGEKGITSGILATEGFILKLFSTPTTLIFGAINKIKDIATKVKTSFGNFKSNYDMVNSSIHNYATAGDVGSMWSLDANAGQTGLSAGMLGIGGFITKLFNTPTALLHLGINKVVDGFTFIKNGMISLATDYSTYHSTLQGYRDAGDISGLWSASHGKEGFTGGLLSVTGFIDKISYTVPTLFHTALNGVTGFINDTVSGVTTTYGKYTTAVDALDSIYSKDKSITTMMSEVSGTTLTLDSDDMFGGIFEFGFSVNKIFTYISLFTRKLYDSTIGKAKEMVEMVKDFATDPAGAYNDYIVNSEYNDVLYENVFGPAFDFIFGTSTVGMGSGLKKAIDSRMSSVSGGDSGFVSQNDSKYSGYSIGGNSFASKGCGPAVASMAAKAFGKNMSVSEAVNASKPYQNGNGVSIDYFNSALGSKGINTRIISGGGAGDMYSELSRGKKVVLLGRDPYNTSKANSPFGPRNHYVLATGLDRSGNVVVNDPELKAPRSYSPAILNSASYGVSGGSSGIRRGRVTRSKLRNNKYYNSIYGGASGTPDLSGNGYNIYCSGSVSGYGGISNYAVMVPTGYTGSTAMPLVVFVHGNGNGSLPCGNDVTKIITTGKWLPALVYSGLAKINGIKPIFLIPQYSSNTSTQTAAGLITLINTIKTQYNIDANRISITGHSGGAIIANNAVSTSAGTFSCAVLMAGYGVCTPSIPVLSFTSNNDNQSNNSMNNAVSSNSGNVSTYEISGLTGQYAGSAHSDVPYVMYTSYPTIDWMVSQTKSSVTTVSRGCHKISVGGAIAEFGGASGSIPASGTSSSIVSDPKKAIWDFFKSRGWTDYGAAGAMGCWQAESGNNPMRLEGDYLSAFKNRGGYNSIAPGNAACDDYVVNGLFPAYANSGISINQSAYQKNGHYYPGMGLAQWTGGRTVALSNYAQSIGANPYDLSTQLNFAAQELDSGYTSTDSAGKTASNITDATKNFLSKYEGGPTSDGWLNPRVANATAIYNQYSGSPITTDFNNLGSSTFSFGDTSSGGSGFFGTILQIASSIGSIFSDAFNRIFGKGNSSSNGDFGSSGYTGGNYNGGYTNAEGDQYHASTYSGQHAGVTNWPAFFNEHKNDYLNLTSLYGSENGYLTSSQQSNYQQALLSRAGSVAGMLQYSHDYDKQNPDIGYTSCSSGVGWTYRKETGIDGISACPTYFARDDRFMPIYSNWNKDNPLDKSKLQAGDILFQDDNRDGDFQHVEMYDGNGGTWNFGNSTPSSHNNSMWFDPVVVSRLMDFHPLSKNDPNRRFISSNRGSTGGYYFSDLSGTALSLAKYYAGVSSGIPSSVVDTWESMFTAQELALIKDIARDANQGSSGPNGNRHWSQSQGASGQSYGYYFADLSGNALQLAKYYAGVSSGIPSSLVDTWSSGYSDQELAFIRLIAQDASQGSNGPNANRQWSGRYALADPFGTSSSITTALLPPPTGLSNSTTTRVTLPSSSGSSNSVSTSALAVLPRISGTGSGLPKFDEKKLYGGNSGIKSSPIVVPSGGDSGISPELISQLIASLTRLLENIADNTSPIEKIYQALISYVSNSGGGSGATDHSPSSATNTTSTPPAVPSSGNIDSNIQNLVGVLAALAKG